MYIFIFLEATDCTLPWSAKTDVMSQVTNHCPKILDGNDKKYCCYSFSGDIECCDLPHFMFFGFV